MVCIDCGKQVYYSPALMRPLTSRELRQLRATQARQVRVMPSHASLVELPGKQGRKTHVA